MDRNRIIIQFPSNTGLIHQIRNFGEDLFRAFWERREATISLDDIDRASDQLVLKVRSRNVLRSVQKTIETFLDQHHLRALATISWDREESCKL